MSQYFIMVATDEAGAPSKAGFRPDSGYLPTILFFDAQGRPMPDVRTSDERHVYAYSDEGAVLQSMYKAATAVRGVAEARARL